MNSLANKNKLKFVRFLISSILALVILVCLVYLAHSDGKFLSFGEKTENEEPLMMPGDAMPSSTAPSTPHAIDSSRTASPPLVDEQNNKPVTDDNEAAPEETPAEPFLKDSANGKDHLLAAFDVNGDDRQDIIVFEKEEALVSQVLLATQDNGFEPLADPVVPDYVSRFLRSAASEGASDEPGFLLDPQGKKRMIIFLNDSQSDDSPLERRKT